MSGPGVGVCCCVVINNEDMVCVIGHWLLMSMQALQLQARYAVENFDPGTAIRNQPIVSDS